MRGRLPAKLKLPKAKAARPDVPVIMITAYGDAETKRKALEGGAEALFTKPIDFGALRYRHARREGRLINHRVRNWLIVVSAIGP